MWGSKIVRNLCSRYHNDAGWNPNQRIFHVWRLAHDEHGENTERDGENTRENTQINTEAITQALDSRYKVEVHDPKSTTVIQIVFSGGGLGIPWDLPVRGLESRGGSSP